jgi:hypothetical protein
LHAALALQLSDSSGQRQMVSLRLLCGCPSLLQGLLGFRYAANAELSHLGFLGGPALLALTLGTLGGFDVANPRDLEFCGFDVLFTRKHRSFRAPDSLVIGLCRMRPE